MAEKDTIVIEIYFTEENLEETIKGAWEKIYEHYCTTYFDLTGCSLTLYLNTVRTYYNFLTTKKLVLHHIKNLYSRCVVAYGDIIATDIFGAIYFLAKVALHERDDIAQGISKCCDYDSFNCTPLDVWKSIFKELSFEQLMESMDSVNTQTSLPSKEELPAMQQAEESSNQPAPKDIFSGFTDKATEADLAELIEKCNLEEGAAKAVVRKLMEYSENEVVDIHGWKKTQLFKKLQALGLSCKINNFYKAFTAKDDLMLEKKPIVL